jgi:hypothetical protein
MSVRNNCAPDINQVSIELTFIPYEEVSEKQRRAWSWLSRELLKTVEKSYRPRPHETKGGRASTGRRRGRVDSTNQEYTNDITESCSPSSDAD